MRDFHPKFGAALWLMLMLGFGASGSRLLTQDWLETAFLALLPVTEQDPAVENAIHHYHGQRDRSMIWLAGGTTVESALNKARQVEQHLRNSALFQSITLNVPQTQFVTQYRQLFPFRYQLLDENTAERLRKDPAAYLRQNQAALYNPLGQIATADLERDPLLLLNKYLQSLNTAQVSLEQGAVIVHEGDKRWALILSELTDSRLELDKLEQLFALNGSLKAQTAVQGGELLMTGMPLFTASGANSAKQEISTVGIGSSLGIIVLMLLTFRSPRPMILSSVAISSGLFAALVVSILLFGKVHTITLIFGASLIGVADDYALHFVCDSFGEPNWRPARALSYLLPGLLMGLLINLLSYAGLVLSPFPGLQEVALFSAVGLLVAWLTVVLLFPLLLNGFQPSPSCFMFRMADYWQQHWPAWLKRHRKILFPLLLLVIFGGLARLEPRDDVRLLQSADAQLVQDAERIKQLLPLSRENQFFLVSGKNVEAWRRNEQNLLANLKALQAENKLGHYQAVSARWPDQTQQRANYALLEHSLYRSGRVKNYMTEVGFSKTAITDEYHEFTAAKDRWITLPEWLNTSDTGTQALWLGCNTHACRSIVALSAIQNTESLASLSALSGVIWVDPAGKMSDLFMRYRVRVSWLVFSAYLAVIAGLGFKFGWRQGLSIIAIPLTATLVALAMIGWFHQLFSLFNLFALLLVLGIGVDDAIFFFMAAKLRGIHQAGADEKRSGTALAVVLSACTTLLAFGLLALSATEIVHAFGFTVAFGILTALILSPLIGHEITLRIPQHDQH